MRRRDALKLGLAALATPHVLPARAQGTTSPGGGKRLTIGTSGAFTSLDPHYHRLTPNNLVADHLFDTLVIMDENVKPTPGLALSWTPINELLWELKLRPGVTFHDGTPFTADDVVFTFERIPKVLNSPASFTDATKPISRMEVVDPLTLRLHMVNPFPLMPLMLGAPRIVSRKNGEGMVTSDYNSGKAAIGTGPYKLGSVLLGDRITFVRNENYWGPKPAWETVNWRLIANGASRTAALQSGDVDVIDQVATRDVATLKANPKLQVVSAPGNRLIYLYLDVGREQTPFAFDLAGKPLPKNPLQDRRVRQALSWSINRDGLRTQIMDGASLVAGQLNPPGASGTDPALQPDRYDVAGARKLLAEAGFPQGFQLTLHGPNDRYVNDRQLVEAIAQMFTRVGVKTTVQTMPSSMFFAAGGRDEFTMSLIGWAPDNGDGSSALVQIVASSNPEKGRGAIFKASRYGNPRTDEIIEKALATFDVAEREKLYAEAVRLGTEDYAYIPLHFQLNIAAMRQGINLRPRLQEGVRAMEVEAVSS